MQNVYVGGALERVIKDTNVEVQMHFAKSTPEIEHELKTNTHKSSSVRICTLDWHPKN